MKKRWIALGMSVTIFLLFVLAHTSAPQSDDGIAEIVRPENQGQSIASSVSIPVPAAVAPTAVSAVNKSISSEDRAKLALVDKIMASKNDNDPRLDKELRVLSEDAKELFRDRYKNFAAEKLNEKGTLVFLLGRNLSTPADFAFLNDVLSEPPCLSLENCGKMAGAPQNPEDQHQDIGNEVTQAYPQLVALTAIEHFLFDAPTAQRTPTLIDHALQDLRSASQSKVMKVASLASTLLNRWQSARR